MDAADAGRYLRRQELGESGARDAEDVCERGTGEIAGDAALSVREPRAGCRGDE